jgi:ligand-binding sensor domain-containing protein/protocatechuate 3,4-dioxygenase beta subunit
MLCAGATARLSQAEGGTISGAIQDDKGAPVADVKVSLSSADFSASLFTKPDGKFEFKNLKPAQYTLTAEAARFRKVRLSLTITKPEDTLNQQIKLTPSSLHVAVFDANNQPLRGAIVALSSKESGATETVRAATDETGDAYFGRLSPGSYQIAAALPGYDEYRSEVFISTGITTEFPLRLQVAPIIPINQKAAFRYSVPNLPSKTVQSVFQDSEGWIWLGTDKGVARFNGSEFKSSAVAGSPYEKIAGENIRSIAEDLNGTIWLATARGARRISKDGSDVGAVLNGIDVRHLRVDSAGNVWVSTATALFKFDGKTFTPFDTAQGLPSNDVRGSAEDRSGRLWVATSAGLAMIEGNQAKSFQQFLQSTGAATASNPAAQQRAIPGFDPAGLMEIHSVFVDGSNKVWFTTSRGAFCFDGYRVSSAGMGKLSATESPIKSAADDTAAVSMSQDRSGRMWFALASGGAALYDPARKEYQRIGPLEGDRVAALLTDREGNIWAATDNGAVRTDFYSFVNFTTSRGLPDNDARAVIEEPNLSSTQTNAGRLWVATSSGVSKIEEERFVPVEGFRASTDVRSIAFDRTGAAWFATDQGVVRLSGQTLTQFNESNGLASNNVHWAASIEDGAALLFATSRGASLFRDGALRSLNGLAGYDVRYMFADADSIIWFATSRGVIRYALATGESELIDAARGLPDNDTRWIARFKGRLLVATRAGVQVLNETARNRSAFTTFDGEPASALFVDRDDYLWVGADDGQIKKFTLVGGHTLSTAYSVEGHGLAGGRVNCISEDAEGRIWIATAKGVIRHLPVRVEPRARVWLRIDGKTESASSSESQSVPYGRHRLIFQFNAASLTGQVRYLYRIRAGQSEERWELLPMDQGYEREVTRSDLDEGEYSFEVVAISRDLYGASSPAAALSFRVGSPVWKRWWFYTIVIAILGLAVAAALVAHARREREYVLPKELRSYVPVEPNPYIVGNPIRTEKMFYGREDDFRYVRTKLEGASQGVIIVFCGERRVGKSSILYQVHNGRLGERFIPVFVDMQEMVIATDSEFFARVSRQIAEAASRAGVNEAATAVSAPGAREAKSLLSVPSFDGRNPYPVFLDFLDEALSAIGQRTLLILVDEYELMESKVDEGKLSSELFTFLAGLMDNKERLSLIFTGSRRLEERDRKYWRELLRRSLFRKVGFLSEKDTYRLVTEPVAERVVYGRGAVDMIYRLTAGQPFYTQVLCQNTVDYLNEHERNWMTVADLQHVIADIVDNPLPQMIYTWDVLSDDEKLVLSLLAEVLKDGASYATARELRSSVRMNEYPVNLSENTIRLTLEEMFRRELLDKDATDGFRFKIDLFRLWIRRSHSIWQVVKEVRTL